MMDVLVLGSFFVERTSVKTEEANEEREVKLAHS